MDVQMKGYRWRDEWMNDNDLQEDNSQPQNIQNTWFAVTTPEIQSIKCMSQ